MTNIKQLGDFRSIDFEKTEDWSKIVQDEVYKENKVKTIVVIIVSIIAAAIIISLFKDYRLFTMALFFYGFYYGHYYSRGKREFFIKLAKENNLIYEDNYVLEDLKTNTKGSSKTMVSDLLIGKYQGRDARFFNYFISRGKGGSKFTFFEISLKDINLPYTLLLFHMKKIVGVERRNDKKTDNEIKITLENKFKDDYVIYVKDGYGIEAMQIFSEDFIDFLIGEKCNFNIELNRDKIYIYTYGRVVERDKLKEFIDTADEVIKRIKPLVKRLERDFRNLGQQYDLENENYNTTY